MFVCAFIVCFEEANKASILAYPANPLLNYC